MEGRLPPPKATHPFPNTVDLTKFWGTRQVRGFALFSISVMTAWAALLGLSYAINKNNDTVFGIKNHPITREDIEKKRKLDESNLVVITNRLQLESVYKDVLAFGNKDADVRFDDGVKFVTSVEKPDLLRK